MVTLLLALKMDQLILLLAVDGKLANQANRDFKAAAMINERGKHGFINDKRFGRGHISQILEAEYR